MTLKSATFTNQVSKLLQLFAARELAAKIAALKPLVVINAVNPGLCYTDLTRHATGGLYYFMIVLRALMAWAAEEGSRTLVHATTCGPESHGVHISGCKIPNDSLGKFVTTPEGKKAQEKLWVELCKELERIQPWGTKDL